MKYTTVMLAMALLMVPLVSATTMAQMANAEVSEARAQTTTEALGQVDLMSTLLGGGIGSVIGGGIGAVCAGISGILGGIWSIMTSFGVLILSMVPAVILDIIATGFAVLTAWITDLVELVCVVPMGIIGALCGAPLVWIISCLFQPGIWIADCIDTCVGAWCPAAIVDIFQACSYWAGDICLSIAAIFGDIVGGIFSCFTPLYAVCFSAIGTILGACWSCVTPLYAVGLITFATGGALLVNGIVDTIDALLNGLVDVLQSCSYWIGDIYLWISTWIRDVCFFGIGDILINGLVDVLQSCSYWIGDIYLYLAATFWDVILFVAGDILLNGIIDAGEALTILSAGLNDIDLGSYLFQSAKICGIAFIQPCYNWGKALLFCVQSIPVLGWIVSLLRAFVQLCLLWNNLFVQCFQHLCPIV